MENTNPYQAPSAEVADPKSETYQPKIFSTQGRIGRFRYLAYCLASYLLIIPFVIISSAIIGITGGTDSGMTMAIVMLIVYVPMLVYICILMKRRFNDLNKSGWLMLSLLIPLINFFIGIWLLVGKGTDGPNNFGPAPVENSLGVKIAAWFAIIITILSIVAAITLPAYMNYAQGL